MPLYEYQCDDCREPAELLIRGDERPNCPACGSPRLTKLLSVVASPSREAAASSNPDPPSGPCGTSCGCFPSA